MCPLTQEMLPRTPSSGYASVSSAGLFMKRSIIFLAACSIAFRVSAEPFANDIPAKQGALGVQLLKTEPVESNTVLSPYSIHAALTLARLGAKGKTAAELDSVLLPAPYSPEILNDYAALNASIFTPREDITVTQANSLWITTKASFKPTFLQDAQRIFAATPQPIDFTSAEVARTTINRWVSSKTNSLIENLLPPGSITTSTVSTLVNALYFKAPWSNQFQKESTEDAPFWIGPGQEPKIPLMHQSQQAAYFENDSWQGVHLTYQRNEFYLLLLVPKEKLSTTALLPRLSPTLLDDASTNTTFTKVNLHMPRFTIRQSQNLTEKLITTGLTTALSGSADYSGIASLPIVISQVQHEAVVMVDERGTEAAAATAVILAASGFMPHPPEPKEVRADHPFIFAIIHRGSRAPLFLGIVADPR